MRYPARKFGYLPPAPNTDSPQRTVTSVYFDGHYANLNLINRWTWDRYARLCEVLRLTPYEMASLVTLKHSWVERFRHNDMLTGSHAEAVALLLTILEGQLFGDRKADTIKDPFPKISGVPTT
mgnify:CR=1 FL=1